MDHDLIILAFESVVKRHLKRVSGSLFLLLHILSFERRNSFTLHNALLTTRPATRTVRPIQSNITQGRTGCDGLSPAGLAYIEHCYSCTTRISVMLLCKDMKADRYVTCWWAVVSLFFKCTYRNYWRSWSQRRVSVNQLFTELPVILSPRIYKHRLTV